MQLITFFDLFHPFAKRSSVTYACTIAKKIYMQKTLPASHLTKSVLVPVWYIERRRLFYFCATGGRGKIREDSTKRFSQCGVNLYKQSGFSFFHTCVHYYFEQAPEKWRIPPLFSPASSSSSFTTVRTVYSSIPLVPCRHSKRGGRVLKRKLGTDDDMGISIPPSPPQKK